MKTSRSSKCLKKSKQCSARSLSVIKIARMQSIYIGHLSHSASGQERQDDATTFPWYLNGSKSNAHKAIQSR